MNDWADRLATARADFRDALEQRRFETSSGYPQWLVGQVATQSGRRPVLIEIGDAFPYRPPGVFPGTNPDNLDVTWHTGPDGWMCLYADNEENTTPWMDVDSFLARIGEWFDRTEAGWPDDAPVMDADRYIPSEPSGQMVLYGDLDPLVGNYVRLVPQDHHSISVHGVETPPARRKGGDRRQYAAVRDVGELLRPIRTWDDVRALVADADRIEGDVRDRRIRTVILRYSRAGRVAALPLRVAPHEGSFAIRVFRSASDADEVRRYRSGPARHELADKRVLIVGVGAIGSFTADLLARDGIGHITLMDWQRLTPGNVVRHLCGRDDIGRPKAEAVAATVSRTHATTTQADTTALLFPEQALAALEGHDLVIDATANGAATAMLHEAARVTGRTVLSACVQNDGDITRVDLLPPLAGEPLPKSAVTARHGPDFYEAGCGDPVSPTPPHAVVQAAALTAKHAVGLLSGKPVHPAGEIITAEAGPPA